MSAPYKRGYHHTKSKGHESMVTCGYCGKMVPRWKTFTKYRGFHLNDPVLMKQLDRRMISTMQQKVYACPSCARARGIVQIGRSRGSRRD